MADRLALRMMPMAITTNLVQSTTLELIIPRRPRCLLVINSEDTNALLDISHGQLKVADVQRPFGGFAREHELVRAACARLRGAGYT